MAKTTASKIRFRFQKNDEIGNPSAESDQRFLSGSFVDTGVLDVVASTDDHRGIILGRTGTGKTALLKIMAERHERSREIDPHEIALGYISNSTTLRFFEAAGVNLDPFYRFLWRHVLVVATLMMHFNLADESQRLSKLDQMIYSLLRKHSHKEAFEYLNEWGVKFVETTEKQIREVTQRMESDLKGSLGVGIEDLVKLGAEGGRRLMQEQRCDIVQRGQEVINNIQISKLTKLFSALDEDILTDHGKRYYLLIDRLDENWVDDTQRYRLIKALIEVMREYNSKVRNGKVVIALRTDLFGRVLQATTDAGFQDEKYRGLCLRLQWNHSSLTELLDRRIDVLARHRYTGESVTHVQVLTGTIGKKREQSLCYMLDRTLMRPRDVIAYFNRCMDESVGEPVIKPHTIVKVEAEYSAQRLKSLCDEWASEYPALMEVSRVLRKRPISFPLSEITDEDLTDVCLRIFENGNYGPGEDVEAFRAYYEGRIAAGQLRLIVAQILYRVGAVGLKHESYGQMEWSYEQQAEMPASQIDVKTKAYPHKMLYREVGVVI